MQKRNPLREKSYELALKIVDLCRNLQKQREYVISRQVLRSGTGIGANIEEAMFGQSKADFISKLSISLKEAQETDYWLRLLVDTKYVTQSRVFSIQSVLREVISLLVAIIKKSKQNP
jgi:four helix bundle protein